MQFPGLETERLVLSDFQTGDETAVFALFSSADVTEYYDLQAFTRLEQARELMQFFQCRFQTGAGIRWAIRLKASGELIGTCGFNSWSSKMQNAVIGYDLLPTVWGNGYAAEAVSAIIATAFNGELAAGPLHRIQADTVPGNQASEALLRKLGFKEEGLRRDSGFWKGRFHDLTCFGLLKTEFSF